MRLDVHQHLWTEPLVAALAARRMPPRARRERDGWWLDLAGEAPCRLELAAEDPGARAALVRADGLDRALVALSGPLGIESLAPGEAEPLLDAYREGVAGLPGEVRARAAGPPRRPHAPPPVPPHPPDQGLLRPCPAPPAQGPPAHRH